MLSYGLDGRHLTHVTGDAFSALSTKLYATLFVMLETILMTPSSHPFATNDPNGSNRQENILFDLKFKGYYTSASFMVGSNL